jgi:enoyl-CoA hydratase/carnithine racemase
MRADTVTLGNIANSLYCMSMAVDVLSERHGPVAVVTLNRPQRLNAWTPALEEQYFDLLDDLDDDPDVRAIVVTGAGRGFCPGMDAEELSGRTEAADPTTSRRRPATHALGVRKPMVAAINGACAGIGLLQALTCDVRFAAEEAGLATSFSRRGLVAELGMPWLLVRLVGQAAATDLLLSGRTVRGPEAARLGLVNAAVPRVDVLAVALAYATDLADNCSPLAMSLVKGQLRAEWERSLEQSSQDARRLVQQPALRAEFAEGVESFVSRRPPRFAPLAPRAGQPAGAQPSAVDA